MIEANLSPGQLLELTKLTGAYSEIQSAIGGGGGSSQTSSAAQTGDRFFFQLEIAHPDSDGDGLLDSEELALGFDAFHPDSDRDGFLDSTEAQLGTDPSDPASVPSMATSGAGDLLQEGIVKLTGGSSSLTICCTYGGATWELSRHSGPTNFVMPFSRGILYDFKLGADTAAPAFIDLQAQPSPPQTWKWWVELGDGSAAGNTSSPTGNHPIAKTLVPVDVVGTDGKPRDIVEIGNWENAFEKTPTGVLKVKDEFEKLDPDAVALRLGAHPYWDSATVSLFSFRRGEDPETATAGDAVLSYDLGVASDGFRMSNYLVLVTDLDEFDDDFVNPIEDVDGGDDTSNDRTIYAEVGGHLRYVINTTDGQTHKVTRPVYGELARRIQLNIISIKSNEGGKLPYFTEAEILEFLESCNRTWAQTGMYYLDSGGNEITPASISVIDHPQGIGVNLDDGLDPLDETAFPELVLSAEMESLLSEVKDGSDQTIDVVFIRNISGPNTAKGFALVPSAFAAGQNPALGNTVFLLQEGTPGIFTLAHEIRHLLLDGGGHADDHLPPASQEPGPGTLPEHRNLMRSNVWHSRNVRLGSKRLTKAQEELSRSSTTLPLPAP